jgi:dTDP-glucose 4,6-dehydratase
VTVAGNGTILVTGGAGFIGANLTAMLLEAGAGRVVVLDLLTYAGNLSSLADHRENDRLFFHRADVNDRDAVDRILAEHRPSRVIHLAAETHVDRSIDDPEPFVRSNINGTCNLLQSCRGYLRDCAASDRERFRFVHVSTDEVYGSIEGNAVCSETAPFAPNSPYAASKAAADHMVRAFNRTYRFPAIITRSANNFGPFQYPEKLIPLILLNCLEGRDLPVYGDGGQVRDWLYVEDHCRGLVLALEDGQPGEEYNLGAGNLSTNLDMVHRICAALEEQAPAAENETLRRRGASTYTELIRKVPDRPGHDQRYAVDSGRIERELGWDRAVTLDQGLERTVAWYLNHRKWWAEARSRPDLGTRPGTAT